MKTIGTIIAEEIRQAERAKVVSNSLTDYLPYVLKIELRRSRFIFKSNRYFDINDLEIYDGDVESVRRFIRRYLENWVSSIW